MPITASTSRRCEARAYGVARAYRPLLVNSVVGFIGPEYLYDGKEIIRAGLEDHFCGKLLGLPLGVDVCYTNHAEADQDDMDNLLTLLAAAGVTFIMGVPGADDVMLNYQSTSFHDALYVRDLFGLKRAPEFDNWLVQRGACRRDLPPCRRCGAAARFCVATDRVRTCLRFEPKQPIGRPKRYRNCHIVEEFLAVQCRLWLNPTPDISFA